MKTVYFIRAIGMQGPIKIGCSFSPTGRVKALEAWSPLPLEIVAEIEGGHDIERRFHERFLASHKAYEWFHWTPELQETIDAINTGTFDTETLPIANGSPLERGKRGNKSPEQRRQMSYSIRCYHARRKSGFMPPVSPYGLTDEKAAILDKYLEAPELHGVKDPPRVRESFVWRRVAA